MAPLPVTGAIMTAQLTKSSWLSRTWEVTTPEGKFTVQYAGKGFGHEKILVNGRIADRKTSTFWFAPRFDFLVGQAKGALEIRVAPWLAVSFLRLTINGDEVYFEG
jgi:hypothetical protein